MMVKFGKIVPTEYQTYYTHGVHLAVQEVLYENNQSNNLDEEKVESDNDEEEDSDSDNEENSRFIDDEINESILPQRSKFISSLSSSKFGRLSSCSGNLQSKMMWSKKKLKNTTAEKLLSFWAIEKDGTATWQ